MSSFSRNSPGARFSRRTVLRGAGVALALPWLESLVRPASAQSAPIPKRFIAFFLPCGAPEKWQPPMTGEGAGWQLSSVLEPLAPLKSKVSVISGLENGSAFNASGSSSVEPSNSRMPGGWLTCVDAQRVRQTLNLPSNTDANGISVDQVMAAHPVFAGKTPLPSLQVGLASAQNYCDMNPCSLSRNVSWRDTFTPLSNTVDPTQLFEQLTGNWPSGAGLGPRRDARKSVLDAVLESAAVARGRLSTSDRPRLDEFLDSVRSVEKRVAEAGPSGCVMPSKPTFPTVDGVSYVRNMDGYDKSVHFDLINELLALGLRCDSTRVATFMIDSERSDFEYTFVPKRTFGALTSTPAPGVCPAWYTGGLNGLQDDYAAIVHWHIGKVAEFCQRLDGMAEENGRSVLDNSIVYLGASMHGSNHSCDRLPVFTVGGGDGTWKTDRHVDLVRRPLRDFYFTLMNGVYGMDVADFGQNLTGAPIGMISELYNA